jgi:hypothetical protein
MDNEPARAPSSQNRTVFLLAALMPAAAISAGLYRITPERSQVGCETIPEYEQYHGVTYEKTGAVPQTQGCYRLNANSEAKPLAPTGKAKIAGEDVTVALYEVVVDGKWRRVWLAPGAVVSSNS